MHLLDPLRRRESEILANDGGVDSRWDPLENALIPGLRRILTHVAYLSAFGWDGLPYTRPFAW